MLIVLEGAKTESRYFKHIQQSIRGFRLEIVPVGKGPEHVVAEAKRIREEDRREARREGDSQDTLDAVWVVVDVDDHAYLEEAIAAAGREGISVALSNPCFESWLILHQKDRRSPFGKSQDAKREWAKICGSTKTQDECNLVAGLFEIADGRARNGLDRPWGATVAGVPNPGTRVGELVTHILDLAGKDAKSTGL
ncbi:RloB family protein [Rhodococcus maanshanensis]|nr:RloB family protein [Rhodococcus maanshanensis]